jgi:hypothetical protein
MSTALNLENPHERLGLKELMSSPQSSNHISGDSDYISFKRERGLSGDLGKSLLLIGSTVPIEPVCSFCTFMSDLGEVTLTSQP